MPRWIGDNLKGSELLRHRQKVVSIFMLWSFVFGGFLLGFGAPTFRKNLLEGKYNESEEWKLKKQYMRNQINPSYKYNVELAQEIMEQARTKDVPAKTHK